MVALTPGRDRLSVYVCARYYQEHEKKPGQDGRIKEILQGRLAKATRAVCIQTGGKGERLVMAHPGSQFKPGPCKSMVPMRAPREEVQVTSICGVSVS